MVSGSAIGTLVVFIWSIIFVIRPVSFPVFIPYLGWKRWSINLTTAPIIAIAILWAAQCIGPKDIRNGIVGTDGVKPYNILILFFSLAYMAITLDITGILQAAAFWVSNQGGSNGWKLFFYFYVMLTVLSVVLGNDPVILSGTAFLVYYTDVRKLHPVSWLMAEFAAANTASMVLFVGNPTNVVICEGFRVNNVAFTAYTILPFLACSVACLFALGFQFRSPKHLPRKLNNSGTLDVRSVLLDPTGAVVGSVLLGSCLAVIIVVSFFHVDVWKISLPFAVAKFVFDIGWDHYRFGKKVPLGDTSVQGNTHKMENSNIDMSLMDIEENILKEQLRHPVGSRALHYEEPRQQVDSMANDPEMLTEKTVTFNNVAGDKSPLTTGVNTRDNTRSNTQNTATTNDSLISKTLKSSASQLSQKEHQPPPLFPRLSKIYHEKRHRFSIHFPTFYTALPRLPFALVPFAFSQFILIEGLSRQGWIEIFSNWLVKATNRQMFPTIWIVGVIGVIMCNISGTNIGATILLTKVVRGAVMPPSTDRAAAIALAVASNIGAVSFTFSASLAGLLWKQILEQKNIKIKQAEFAFWNALPLLVMTAVGLGVVCAEMAVLYKTN